MQQKGLEYVKNNELLLLIASTPLSRRVKIARVRLVNECRMAHEEEPIRKAVFGSNLRRVKRGGRVWPRVWEFEIRRCVLLADLEPLLGKR